VLYVGVYLQGVLVMQAWLCLINLTLLVLQHDSQCGGDDHGTNSVCNDGDSHGDCNNNQSLRWVPEKRQGTQ
jgi:hypothetical protein